MGLSFLSALLQLPMDMVIMDGLKNMLHQCVQKKFAQPVKIMDLPLIKQSSKPIVMNNATNVNSVLGKPLRLFPNAKNFARMELGLVLEIVTWENINVCIVVNHAC